MPFAYRLRPAGPDDVELLLRHRRRMYEEMGRLHPGTHDASETGFRRWLAPRLASGEVLAWVAQSKARAFGMGCLWFQPWHPRPNVPGGTIPYLVALYVEPQARRKGVARAILEQAVAAAEASGHPRMSLHATDAGRPLYERLGFKPSPEMWLDFPPP